MHGAQEHPWMARMAPRSAESGLDGVKGTQRSSHPNFKQVGPFFLFSLSVCGGTRFFFGLAFLAVYDGIVIASLMRAR